MTEFNGGYNTIQHIFTIYFPCLFCNAGLVQKKDKVKKYRMISKEKELDNS